jgi:predicted dehydrogenase
MAPTPTRTCDLSVGLAGLTFHIPFILTLSEIFTLTDIFERNPSSPGGKLQDRFGVSVRIHRTLHSVLDDPDINLIVVGTPSATRYDFAKSALLAGKHGAWHYLAASQPRAP